MPAGNMAPQLVHFYIHSNIWTGLSVTEVRRRLQLLLDACNSVWKKNTSLNWSLGNVVFDTQSCPKSNSPVGGPAEGFAYHVQLVPHALGGRGTFLYALDGGVCAWNLRCTTLSPDVDSDEFSQLVSDILHEYGHIIQGEGYFCITFRDHDKGPPQLPDADVRYGTPESLRYWRTEERRLTYLYDPMVRSARWRNIKWSPVNALQLDRPQNKWLDLPSVLKFKVTLNGKPVRGAKLCLFDCEYTGQKEESVLYFRGESDVSGLVEAHYDYNDGGLPPDNKADRDARYRTWKVTYSEAGKGYAAGNFISAVDLWEDSVDGMNWLDVPVELNPSAVPIPEPDPEPEPEDPPVPGGTSDLTKDDIAAIEAELNKCAAQLSASAVSLRKIAHRL